MKWKTGAALMILVLLVAMIPAAVSAFQSGGIPTFIPKPQSHTIVFQIDNPVALRDDEMISLDDGTGTNIPPYIDANGNMLVPIRPLVEGLGGQLIFEDNTFKMTVEEKTVHLEQTAYSMKGVDDKTYSLPVTATRNGNSFFVPGRAVTEALGGEIQYIPPAEGGYVICTIGDTDEKQMEQLRMTAQEKLGYSVEQYLKDCLVVRNGSNSVLVNGSSVKMTGIQKARQEEDGLYFPAEALPKLTDNAITFSDAGIQQNEKPVNMTTKVVDDVTYFKMADLATVLGKQYCEPAEGIGAITGYPLDGHKQQMRMLAEKASGLPSLGNIPEADAYIALTYDDGPTGGSSGLTVRLLDALKERGAHATFFMCGYRIKDFNTHMDRYLAEGHEVANHTMNHPMKRLDGQSREFIYEEVNSNSELIASYVGQPPTLMRPVGGGYDDTVKEVMKELGLPIVNWSLDTKDWENRDADIIYQKIVDNAQDGDIVLMHDLRQCTLDGTIRAIDELKKRGFAFVTVSELAAIKGVEMEPGVLYTDFRDETVAKLKGEAAE